MPRAYPKRRKDPPIKTSGTRGFSLGLNQLTHPTTIKDNELAEAQNTYYSQNGVLSKRPGSIVIGSADEGSTIVNSLAGVYSINGNDYLLRISDTGTLQYYDFSFEVWLDVPGSPTFSDVNSIILQAYGYVYILNATDDMVKWDGSSFVTFTEIANPSTPPTVVKVGKISEVSIGAGGTGYAVNDILTIAGGNGDGKVKVTGVSGGVVTSVEIYTSGSGYKIASAQATTADPSASRSGCTIDIDGVGEIGQREYFYRYVWFNEVGNTLASGNDSIADMPDVLDSDTFVEMTLPTPPAGVTKVGVWKGTLEGEETFMAWVPVGQDTYEDKGFDPVDPLYGVPSNNSTGGFHFYFVTVYNDTLIGVTVEEGVHTLVFSGGGDKFDAFGRADGGGYYAWRKDDGDPITGVHQFQEELYVFKSRKIGAFKFDEQGGAVRDINLATGAVSHRSIHSAGNDLRFWSREGAMSIGNEPNFADLIRTKVLSARAERLVQSLSPTEFNKISGVYYKNISLWGIPTGEAGSGITSVITYDERYVAWSEWYGLTPNQFVKFVDPNGVEKLFYGDAQSGNVVECWNGTSDNGTAIVWRVATKQFDMERPHQYKTFFRVYFIFGNVTGVDTRITLVEDGQRTQVPLALYADEGNIGFGVDEWGTMEFGDSSGEFTGDVTGLNVRYLDLGSKDLFSLQAILSNNGVKDSIEFMGILIEYRESARPLPSSKKLTRIQE